MEQSAPFAEPDLARKSGPALDAGALLLPEFKMPPRWTVRHAKLLICAAAAVVAGGLAFVLLPQMRSDPFAKMRMAPTEPSAPPASAPAEAAPVEAAPAPKSAPARAAAKPAAEPEARANPARV